MSTEITLPILLRKTGKFCIHIGASQEAKKNWREEIEKTLPHLYSDLHNHFDWVMQNLPEAKRKEPEIVQVQEFNSALTTTWIDADKASQRHYWSCSQCKAVELNKTGKRCAEGQKLHEEYIEAALKEKRLKTSIYSRKQGNSGINWSVHAEWRKAYQDYYAHYCKCHLCKAANKNDGSRCSEGAGLYAIYQEAQRRN